MRIGIAAARLSGVDGVSFETAKWEQVLGQLGHEVRLCTGQLDGFRATARVIPAMQFFDHEMATVSAAAFDHRSDPVAVRREIERLADVLGHELRAWVQEESIELLVVENAWAIPMQLPLGLALARLAADTGLPTIGHHHDFWWERTRFADCIVPDVLEVAFPPDLPNVSHATINSLAAAALRQRRGIGSTVIPNVYDFSQPMPETRPDIRAALRRELSMGPNDLLVVQPTRVVPRKGIELSVELLARLGDPRAVLLITGPSGDEGDQYLQHIKHLARSQQVALRHTPQRFAPDHDGPPMGAAHSLVDAYLAADLIAYPSLYEGFGNALLESVFFGCPLLVNRYPVYVEDIAPLGFRFIEIDEAISDDTVADVRSVVGDPARRQADAEHNREAAARHFGYPVLHAFLRQAIEDLART